MHVSFIVHVVVENLIFVADAYGFVSRRRLVFRHPGGPTYRVPPRGKNTCVFQQKAIALCDPLRADGFQVPAILLRYRAAHADLILAVMLDGAQRRLRIRLCAEVVVITYEGPGHVRRHFNDQYDRWSTPRIIPEYITTALPAAGALPLEHRIAAVDANAPPLRHADRYDRWRPTAAESPLGGGPLSRGHWLTKTTPNLRARRAREGITDQDMSGLGVGGTTRSLLSTQWAEVQPRTVPLPRQRRMLHQPRGVPCKANQLAFDWLFTVPPVHKEPRQGSLHQPRHPHLAKRAGSADHSGNAVGTPTAVY